VAALVGTALLLAGCSDDPEPRFVPPSESPSPTESATSAEPAAQTPEEFIREWFSVGADMQNTGDTEAFLAMTSSCDSCQSLADRVARYYADGGFIRIASQDVTDIVPRSDREFSVVVDAAATTFKESSTGKRRTLPGGPNEFRVFIRKDQSGWKVTDFMDTPS